jgi:hypothetical protein
VRQLWADVSRHAVAAGGFLLYWVAVYVFTFATWSRGMSNRAVLFHVASPVIAGALVGWWRYPRWESLLDRRWHMAEAPLAGAILALAIVSVVFVREAVQGLASGNAHIGAAGGMIFSWLVASVLLGAIGAVLALFGALLSRLVAGVLRRRVPRSDTENG